jgi:hypothetical protein
MSHCQNIIIKSSLLIVTHSRKSMFTYWKHTATLKVHLHELFWLKVVWPNEPSGLQKKVVKYFRFFLNSPRCSTSACILHLHSICTDSFCVFSVYKQINCTYSQYRDRLILQIQTFGIFSVNEQSHSTYSQYTNRFILHILSVCTDSFCLFGKYVHPNNFEYSELNSFLRSFLRESTSSLLLWKCVP